MTRFALFTVLLPCCALFWACDDGASQDPPAEMIILTDVDVGPGPDVEPDLGIEVDQAVPDMAPEPEGLALLGAGTHDTANVRLEVVADATDRLSNPQAIAFDPAEPDQLWIVNADDDSMVIVTAPGTPQRDALRLAGPGNSHFFAEPSGLAFGMPGTFATSHREDQPTQATTPGEFMGPTLWTTDLRSYDAGHAGHLDMLHNSPSAAGIAWDRDNAYWVFDGMHQSLTRYDFREDHGPGGAPHEDGIVARFVEGEVGYVPGVVSHLQVDHDAKLLYVADSGNGRIAVLDTRSGSRGQAVGPNFDGTNQFRMNDADLTTFAVDVDGLEMPAGLALHAGHVWVTDNQTSRVLAFDMQGALVDWLDLSDEVPAGGLMGMAFDADGQLYVCDAAADRILRITPTE